MGSYLVTLIKTNNSRQKVLSCLFLECSHVVYTKTIIHQSTNQIAPSTFRLGGFYLPFTLPSEDNC